MLKLTKIGIADAFFALSWVQCLLWL